MACTPPILTRGSRQLVEQHLYTLWPSCHGAQRVQCADVAGPLPYTHQRRLAIQPLHAGLLDIAVAAKSFHRLRGVWRGALAHPVLACRQADAAQQCLTFVAADRT